MSELKSFGPAALEAVSASLPGRPLGAPSAPFVLTEEKWKAAVAYMRGVKAHADNLQVIVDDHDKKLKRLVAITLRDDFQRDYPWDPEAQKSTDPENAAQRAAQQAARLRQQQAKRDAQKK